MASPSFEPFPDIPGGESQAGSEFDAQVELLVRLHRYHEHSTSDDYFSRGSVLEIEDRPPISLKLFLRNDTNPTVLNKYSFDEMVWQPRPATKTASMVTRILIRYPQIDDYKYAEYGLEGVVTPQDILVEIEDIVADQPRRYVLNDLGLTPYLSADALVFDETEITNPSRRADIKPNVYRVQGIDWATPFLSIVDFKRMLLDESTYSQREDTGA